MARAGSNGTSRIAAADFSLHTSDAVWIVNAGCLDLYVERVCDDGSPGAREYLLSVTPGHAAFALGISAQRPARIAARPAPGARIEILSRDEFRAMSFGERSADMSTLLEGWIDQLAEAVSEGAASRSAVAISPETLLNTVHEPRVVAPAHGFLWVRHRKGCSWFQGNREFELNERTAWFPVSRCCWLEAGAGSTIEAAPTASVIHGEAAWRAVDGFHAIAFECLLAKRSRAEEKERTRFQARAECDQSQMQRVLRTLADLLHPAAKKPSLNEETFSYHIYRTCQAIGDHQGIKFQPHPDMVRGEKLSEPVEQIARASGVRWRLVAMKEGWWRGDSGALLAARERDHRPLALIPRAPGRYVVYDAVERTTVPFTPDMANDLHPMAWMFYRPFPAREIGLFELLKFAVASCEPEIRTVTWAGAAAGILGIAMPVATAMAFNQFIPAAERTQLQQTAVFLAVLACASGMLMLARGFASLRLEGKMDAAVQAAVWDRLLSLPVPFFRNYSSGDLAQRSLGIAEIRRALTGSTLTSILSGIFSAASFALLFYYSWRLAVLATVLVGSAFAVSTGCGYLQLRHQRDVFAMRGRITGMVSQFINGIAKLRVAGAESRAFVAWARQFTAQRRRSIAARRIGNVLTTFLSVFPLLSLVCIFPCAARLLEDPKLPSLRTGDFFAFLAAFTQFSASALQLSSSLVAVLRVMPLYERARPILRTLPEVDAVKSAPHKLEGGIEVSNLTFRYRADGPLVLDAMSFRIEPGQYVAFVGPSGCGKSTLFRLLLGFEKPDSGVVYYDGRDLSALDVHSLRRQLGVVLQASKLASGDLYSNIVGSAQVPIETAWEAARAAGMEEDIKAMPMGMHTMISEGGGGLSGGQKQRLMIARAIVHKPRILLFDEATSALDNRTQAIVAQSLEGLRATRVVIAHRLSTIVKADRIFVLGQGRIAQSGTFEELMNQDGLFRKLALRQIL